MIISVQDVYKSYVSEDAAQEIQDKSVPGSLKAPRALRVLNGVSLDVQAGEFVSLMGASGCGKSTLLSLIYGLDQPDAGCVKIMDRDLSTLTGDGLTTFRAETVGMIFQQFHLLPFLTAIENIELPLQLTGRITLPGQAEWARTLLKDVGLSARKDHYPHQLSRGECQRVAIARALTLKPPLLLADEPTGSLDQATALRMLQLLKTLLTDLNTALVMVTHDPLMTSVCNRRFHFSEGKLIEG